MPRKKRDSRRTEGQRARRDNRRRATLDHERLERRLLLASLVSFDQVSGRLSISHDSTTNTPDSAVFTNEQKGAGPEQYLVVTDQNNDMLFDGETQGVLTSDVKSIFILGSDGPDFFDLSKVSTGTPYYSHALDGNITVRGGRGNDTIEGAQFDNLIFGEDGFDSLIGGIGDDTISGGPGNDTIKGGMGNDSLMGDGDDDSIMGDYSVESGFDGNDTIDGGAGADWLFGGNGNDYITTGGAPAGRADTAFGGSGNDTLVAQGAGLANLFGGKGSDYIDGSQSSGGLLRGDLEIGVLSEFGTAGNDTIIGSSGPNQIFGDGGDDSILGGAGSDTIYAGSGNDYVEGGEGNDVIYGQDGCDSLFGENGDDTIDGGNGDDLIGGPNEADVLTGGSGNNIINGVNDNQPATDCHPTIGAFSVTPQPAYLHGGTLVLKSSGVVDPDDGVAGVAYYLDADGNSKLDANIDTFIGNATKDAQGNWVLNIDLNNPSPLKVGSNTVFAQATGTDGMTGPYVTKTVVIKPPTVGIKATVPNANEASGGPAEFTITSDIALQTNLAVSYTLSGTAVNGTDYSTLSGTVVIPAGSLDAPIEVEPLDDGATDDSQASGTVVATLSPQPSSYAIDPASQDATVSINEEPPPTVTIAASVPNAVEYGSPGVFTVSRTGPTDDWLFVNLASSGTAVAGTNYQTLSSGVVIMPGARSASLTVNALDDGTPGGNDPETVTETIQPSSSYNVGTPSSANVAIQEEGYTTVTIAATGGTREGSPIPGQFTVTRQAPYDQPLTVNYALSGSAINGTDYQSLSGAVTIPADSPTAQIDVTPLDDGDGDGDDAGAGEDVTATLQPAATYAVGDPSSATVTIGEEPSLLTLSASAPDVSEQSSQGILFTVSRTGPTTSAVTVGLEFLGPAQKGVDFVDPGTSITIPAGQTSATFTIVPIDDGDNDDNLTSEYTVVSLGSVSGEQNIGLGTPSSAALTFIEDSPPTVALTAVVSSTYEGGPNPAEFVVSRSGPTTSPLTVEYNIQGTASPGTDYVPLSGTVTIPAGRGSAKIDVTPLDDESQNDEGVGYSEVDLQLSPGSGYQLSSQDSGSVQIDEEPPPVVLVYVGAVPVEGGPNGDFVVHRSGAVGNPLTVDYTVSGTAYPGMDYESLPGSVLIPAGSADGVIDLTALEDSMESNPQPESVVVTLSNENGGFLIDPGGGSAGVIIQEQPFSTVTITAGPDATEAGAHGEFTVTRTAPFTAALTVQYTVSGSAVAGSDYETLSGTVTIAAGAPSAVIDVAPLDDGSGDDPGAAPESIVATLSGGSGYMVASPLQAQINVDEEPPPTVTISAAGDATEGGDSGEFSVARTGPTDDPLTVSYTVGGTATPGSDYTALSGTVTIPAGTSTAVITVAPLDDGDGDDANPPAQNVVATLAGSANYVIGQQATATVNINEEPPPVVTIADTADTTEGGDPGQFTVTRTGPTDDALTVNFTVGGTAVSGTDYTSIGTSVTIPAGQDSTAISVSSLDDLTDDANSSESVEATIASAPAYTIGLASSSTLTINEEPPPVVTMWASNSSTEEFSSTPGEFTVYRSGPLDNALVVNYALGGTATNGADYQTLSGAVTIPAGSDSAVIEVTPIDDGADDPSVVSKDVVATVSPSSAYTIGTPAPSATVTIIEDPVVTIAATTASTTEDGATPGEFTVTRGGSLDIPLEVAYTLSGTAQNGTDYASLFGTVEIPAGAIAATIDIDPIDDVTDDGNASETVTATLSPSSTYELGAPNSDTVTIYEEPLVTIIASTPTTAEDGGTSGVFTISRTGPTGQPLTVNFTVGGTAVSGTDYTPVGTSATIAAGQASVTITVSPIDDLTDDGNASETVVATLVSGGYEIGTPSSATVTIDEEPPPTVTIVASTATTAELSSTPGAFTVSRTGPTDGSLAVNYTLGGTAVNGTDYSTLSGTVTIPDGQASATFNVTPLDDLSDDGNSSESVAASLAGSSAYIVGSPDTATVTIDEEAPPVVTIAATTANTAELSGTPGVFTVTRSAPLDGNLVVNYVMSGSATNGADYSTLSGSVTIPDGQASATFDVAPLDDGDGDDSSASAAATATLAAGSGYTVGGADQATVTIYEEPMVTIAATTATTGEYGAAPGVFTVTRTGLTSAALTVYYTLGGSAAAGTDYQNPGGSVMIAAGQTSANFDITPIDDGDGDDSLASENVVATVSASSAYSIGSPSQATVTIAEESPPVVTIAATTASTLETGSSPGVFTVSRTGPTDDLLTVNLTFGGTATPGGDYAALGSSFTFGVGESSVALDVSPIDDGDGDDSTLSQSVTATVASGAGYSVGSPDSATVTIDEDYVPTVTIAATTANVGEVSGGSGVFTVSFSGPAPNDITVYYGVSGSAVSNSDYQGLSGSVIVPAGHTSATIDVTPLDDGDGDDGGSSANVTATLQSSSAYVIGSPNAATVTISEDNAPPPPTVTIVASNATTNETGGSPGVLTVSIASAPSSNLSVQYSLTGTAVNGTDYQALTGSVTIPAYQTSATIQVTPIDDGDGDDNLASESMTATLQAGSGYTVGNPASASVTIDEDQLPQPTVTISADYASMPEQGGSDQLGIDLSTPASGNVTVTYTLSGTAVNGTDYQTLSGTATISQGQSYVMVPLVAIDDGDGDDNITSESVIVTLQTATGGYTIGSPNSVTVTIEEDSSPPPELLSLPPNTANPVTTSVTVPEIRALIPAAAARWEAAGVDRSTIAADLRGLQIIVADLSGSALGEALPGRLWIDTNAAGYGWFIDRTPRNDSEFSDVVAPTELQAVGNSPAVGHVDLLTVIMHEMGHLLGLPEADGPASIHDVMSEVLGLSTRRLPDAADLALLTTAAGPPPTGTADRREAAAVDAVFRDGLIQSLHRHLAVENAGVAPSKNGSEILDPA